MGEPLPDKVGASSHHKSRYAERKRRNGLGREGFQAMRKIGVVLASAALAVGTLCIGSHVE
jgi:hypothetical protein